MTSKKKQSRTRKVLLVLAGIIIILLVITSIALESFIEGKVKEQLAIQFNDNPNSNYSVEAEKIGIRIFRGSVFLKMISVTPKESIVDKYDSAKIRSLIKAEIETYELRGLKIIKFFREKKVDVNKLLVQDMQLNYYINKDFKDEKSKAESLTGIFSDALKSIFVKSFDISNADIKFLNNDKQVQAFFELDSLSIILSDILVDSSTALQVLPFSFSDLNIETKHFSIKSLDYNDISTSQIILDVKDSTLLVNGFKFIPTLSKEDYNKQIPYEKDLYSFKADQLKLTGLDIRDIIENKRIFLSSIQINELIADIYRDKTLPDPPSKEKPLFASLIQKIPLQTSIDSLLIINSKLTYDEKQQVSDVPGEVDLDQLNIKIYNITNDSINLANNHVLQMIIDARLMGQGNMKVWLNADLNSQEDDFKATGLLGPIPGIAFNKLTKNLLLAEIQMGKIHNAWFSFEANNDESFGKLKIDYENLKIVAWKTEDEKKARFLTFVGNKLIRKSNLKEDPGYRTGVISFERSKDKGIPNYLWKSVQSGIIAIIAPLAENKKQRETGRELNKDRKQAKKKLTK